MDPIRLMTSAVEDPHSLKVSERGTVLEVTLECRGDTLPSDETVKAILGQCHPRDEASLSLVSGIGESLYFRTQEDVTGTEEFRDDLDPDDTVEIKLTVDKRIVEGSMSIYSYQHFSEWLLSRSLRELMHSFDMFIAKENAFVFDLLNDDLLLATKTIVFRTKDKSIDQTAFDRLGRLALCRQVASFHNAGEYGLLPDDFHVVVSQRGDALVARFAQLETLLSMVYIGSSSALDGNGFTVRIDGHKNTSFCYQTDTGLAANTELFRIYDWIYTDGNPADKAIIARNVISHHCKYVDLIRTTDETYASIQSNFALYQKDNVYKYLELKNKLAEFIIDLVARFGEATLGLADKLKANMTAFFAFLVTAFLGNLVSSNPVPLTGIFTKEITRLSYFVLAGSLAYMIIGLAEMHYKMQRISKGYDALKDGYRELLDENDLAEMFRQDKVLRENQAEAARLRIIICAVWLIALVAVFFVVEALSTAPVLLPHLRAFLGLLKLLVAFS